jgi:hypothetical protein
VTEGLGLPSLQCTIHILYIVQHLNVGFLADVICQAKLNYDAGEFASMVDPRMGRCPPETLEPLVRLAVSCCREMPDARPNMAEVVRDLEEIARNTAELFPDSFSLDLAPSNRVDPAYLPMSYQFTSSADTSELMSGTNMNVTPR